MVVHPSHGKLILLIYKIFIVGLNFIFLKTKYDMITLKKKKKSIHLLV